MYLPRVKHELDVLAIAAHRDDAELTCGGTLARLKRLGRRTGIVDLTEGEMGTRGSAATRADEAARAAEVLGVEVRENLSLPDAGIVNSPETREALARVIRRLRPAVVIAPAQDIAFGPPSIITVPIGSSSLRKIFEPTDSGDQPGLIVANMEFIDDKGFAIQDKSFQNLQVSAVLRSL